MKLTLNWLRELVEVSQSADALCALLVKAGLEVEAVERREVGWGAVEIAEILDVTPHPGADRLRLCRVQRATDVVGVVCGASNMAVGDKVALAPPGAVLPDGRRIERATIRGQASEGMLCSEAELELEGGDASGILILPPDAPLGRRLVDYLGLDDTVIELGITPNRGDCLSVLGVAREVAALTGAPLRAATVTPSEGDGETRRLATVRLEAPDLCPRYCARIVRGVRIGPSPPWLRTRLALVGVRAVSNLVDATNYVLLERGQPTHAFDLARIAESRIVVRRAGQPIAFTTLDGIDRQLVADDLVIADARGPVALAGVMGGTNSEIRDHTTDVLLESAFFVPETVRRTARRLGLASESSYRFERGVDPAGTAVALDRLAALVVTLAGGTCARGVLERKAPGGWSKPTVLALRPSRVNALLGTDLAPEAMAQPLRALGAEVRAAARGTLRVVVPPHRFDLQAEIDLVEEVARLTGYDQIAATVPRVPVGGPGLGERAGRAAEIRAALRAAGLSEMVTLGMVAVEDNRDFPGLPWLAAAPVALANPLSAEGAEMRRSLLPGLLRALAENLRQGEPLVAGFSLGRVFGREGDRFVESESVALLCAGRWPAAAIGEGARVCEFADLKGILEWLFAHLHVPPARWEAGADGIAFAHPGKAARIVIEGTPCGFAGALHPDLVAARGLDDEPWLAELDLPKVVQYCPRRITFRPLPRFPAIQRDVAVVVATGFQAQQILDAVREANEPLVEEVRVFDHYTGAPIPEGKKSLAYSISYRAADRTLTDEEVNSVHARLVERLVARLPLEVR